MVMKLFSDGSSDSDSGELSKIEINEDYARRFEHNKKREDLHRFEELKKKGVIGSEEDDTSDDDEDDIVNYSSKHDLKFFDALIKVRNKDPSLKNNDAKLFDSDNEDDPSNNEVENNVNVKEMKRKPMYLKDVNAKHLLEKGPEFEDDDDVENNNKSRKKSYVEEQEMTRKEFLDAVKEIGDDDDDDEGDFLKVKEDKSKDSENEDEIEYEKKLDEYFKEDEKLDENEKFLKDYFRKKMWLEKEKSDNKRYDIDQIDGIDFSEDEEEIYRQEDYEKQYNFRFEENRDDRVEGHSRVIGDSVRKKDNARKLQRKNKEERMAQAEFDRKEELKHLKNLKKKEMNEKIRKIREIAGIGENDVCVLDERDLEEEFDPEEYDRKMKKAFDDKFYEADDLDPEFGSDEDDGELKKPNFDEEDDLLGLPKGWDDDENHSGNGFLATREKTLKKKVEQEIVSEQGEKKKKKKKRKSSELEEEVIKKELEEYYKLDYEDTIGDLKTRFKYRPVNKNTYGLKAKDILIVDDKELNQLIPLKKMATYREDEFIVPRNKIKEQKQKIKSLLKGESSDGSRNVSTKLKHEVDDVETEQPKSETENEEQKPLSKKQRRKMRNNEFKLSTNRLIAYDKIPAKSNKKRKNKA